MINFLDAYRKQMLAFLEQKSRTAHRFESEEKEAHAFQKQETSDTSESSERKE